MQIRVNNYNIGLQLFQFFTKFILCVKCPFYLPLYSPPSIAQFGILRQRVFTHGRCNWKDKEQTRLSLSKHLLIYLA